MGRRGAFRREDSATVAGFSSNTVDFRAEAAPAYGPHDLYLEEMWNESAEGVLETNEPKTGGLVCSREHRDIYFRELPLEDKTKGVTSRVGIAGFQEAIRQEHERVAAEIAEAITIAVGDPDDAAADVAFGDPHEEPVLRPGQRCVQNLFALRIRAAAAGTRSKRCACAPDDQDGAAQTPAAHALREESAQRVLQVDAPRALASRPAACARGDPRAADAGSRGRAAAGRAWR